MSIKQTAFPWLSQFVKLLRTITTKKKLKTQKLKMKLITPIALMAASAMAENCLPANPPSSIAGALSDFSDSATQCITSAANVLSASAANIINLQADKIADLEENVAQLEGNNTLLQTLVENASSKVYLVNPRFSNGKFWNYNQWDLNPNRAIDGVAVTSDVYKSHAHTSSDNEEKVFIADVESVLGAHISQITLIPRQDCCFERYQQTEIFLQKPDGSLASACSPVNAPFTSAAVIAAKTSGLVWTCDLGTTAIAIHVKNPNNVHLQIAEITAKGITNPEPESVQLTLSNPKFADNKYYNSGAFNLSPNAAIDGSWVNHAWNNGFAHSKSANNPKFLVDLPENAVVKTVTIYPRNNCCFDRYSKMTVQVGGVTCTPAQAFSSTYVKNNIQNGLVWDCNNASGQNIEVVNKNYIQIAEITAVGYQL